jgi:hypothetical protein
VLSWLSVGSGVASWNHSFCQRLRCSGVALCLWLGDNGVALSMVKRAHQHYSNKAKYGVGLTSEQFNHGSSSVHQAQTRKGYTKPKLERVLGRILSILTNVLKF